MGKSSKTPKAPDPYVTAQAQAQANKEAILESARVNQINEVTPYGTLSYSGTIGQPNRTRTTALSPSGQRQLDTSNAIAEALSASALGRTGQINQAPFTLEGVPELYSNYLNVSTPSAPSITTGVGGLAALGAAPTRDQFISGYTGGGSRSLKDITKELRKSGKYTTTADPNSGDLYKQYLSGQTSNSVQKRWESSDGFGDWLDRVDQPSSATVIDWNRLNADAQSQYEAQQDKPPIYDDAAFQTAYDDWQTKSDDYRRQQEDSYNSQIAAMRSNAPANTSNRVGNLEQALYDRSMMLLRPDFDRQRNRTEQLLADRGLPIGQEAYNDVVGQLDRSQNEAQLAAALEAIAGASAEDSRLFGQSLTARQQGINERLLERTQPINELALMLGGSPSLATPQFGANAQYQISPADVQGAIQNNYLGSVNAANQQNSNNNAALGGLFGLGGTILSAGSGSILGGLLGL